MAGLQRILIDEQFMTVWKASKPEADAAAEIAVALAKGDDVPSDLINQQVDNGQKEVPSVILTPVAILKADVKKVVDGGDVTAADLCKGKFESACTDGGNPITESRERAAWRPAPTDRMSTNGAPLLALEGVSKRFGPVQALEGVDFEVRGGEVVALVGDNGAGKSTLVKSIPGIHATDEGRFTFEGRAGEDQRARAMRSSWGSRPSTRTWRCATTSTWWPTCSSGQEVTGSGPGAVTRQLDEIAMEHRSHELLEQFAVTIPSVRSEVGGLSGGQRQQVAVARSLLGEPKVVLLDEPTAALGVAQTATVLELIKRLRERGLGVVVISHNLADVFEVADRVFVLRLGRPAGTFDVDETSREDVVAAITGADGGEQNGNGAGPPAMSTTAPPAPTGLERPTRREILRRFVQGDLASLRVILGLVVIWIIFQSQNDRFLTARQPHQPDAPDHGGRPDLGRRRVRAAAGRDRPLGRCGQRSGGRGDGGAERQARLGPVPRDRRRRARAGWRSGWSRARCSPASASRRSWSRSPGS